MISTYGHVGMNYLAAAYESDEDLKAYTPKIDWRFEHLSDGESVLQNQFEYKWGIPMIWVIGPNRRIEYVGRTIKEAISTIDMLR